MIFMAVNTPTKKEGEGAGMAADLTFVEACAKNIALVSKSDKIVIENNITSKNSRKNKDHTQKFIIKILNLI